MQLRHIGLVTKTMQRSVDFYTKWFGCSVAREMDESGTFVATILGHEDAYVRTVKLNFPSGKCQLELLQFKNPETESHDSYLFTQGLTHFAMTVKNIDDLYSAMSKDGVPFISEPQLSDDGMAKVCFCKDPNGVYLELVELNQ
ncbi:MAG: VOC family protein [Alphaproteobacteria bacterium]|nr:VOC family protein [Alphaproteobacteria bacterium]